MRRDVKDLNGKVAVVTGGASGIGLALARRFLDEGMRVAIADIEDAAIDQAACDLDAGERLIAVHTDVRDEVAVQALAAAAVATFGQVDVVCNNAGVETGGTFLHITEQAWRWVMDVNFFGVLHGCRTFLPLLLERPEGHVVNTASVAAFSAGTATMAPYGASKAAILALSESLEVELRASGARVGVSVLAPGPVKTRMIDAERNRPQDVPLADEPERLKVMAALARTTEESGLDPAAVAGQVADAIRTGSFYVLPHPEMALNTARRRMRWLETGEPPAARQPGT